MADFLNILEFTPELYQVLGLLCFMAMKLLFHQCGGEIMQNKFQRALVLVLAVNGLSACQKVVDYSKVSASENKVQAEGDFVLDPTADEPNPTEANTNAPDNSAIHVEPIVSRSCDSLLAAPASFDLNAVEDLNINGQSGNTIINGVRNLSIQSVSGDLTVLSADHVILIQSISGNAQINAKSIDAIEGISGNYCLKADHVGTVQAASGAVQIQAKTIESLTVLSGTLHIYGATVNHLDSVSGQICLHDGAKISNFDPATSSVQISENCQ
jgi:hypothetical protein